MHLDEMDIGASWKGWVLLQRRTETIKVQSLQISDLDHGMGVAHANGGDLERFSCYLKLSIRTR